ncbi:hypothetical protein [Yonghaparkia sp. Soil809]|uniref:hypothetical protein n=1 Tax=Yonghaparkia sp. Soil809 TaxID=1736417 RepID=UPI0006FCDEC3|nr:hypothetical protein [Yonghaparkia sp. Soil809]KRF32596.1 hypothetical protein ASG83_00570 [Yonghaparkia sp. Soil809]
MTTSNEPPLSRRAARRAQQDAQTIGEPRDPAPLAQPDAPQSDSPERSASFAAVHSAPAHSAPAHSAPVDSIEYRTEVRPRVPRYEPLSPLTPASGDDSPALPPSAPLAPPFAPPTAPGLRRETRTRDFRPPAERARTSFSPVAQPEDAALDYRTQQGPSGSYAAPAPSAPAPSAPVASAPTVDPAFAALDPDPVPETASGASADVPEPDLQAISEPQPEPEPEASPEPDPERASSAPAAATAADSGAFVLPEYTMTRRELRALREKHEQQSSAVEPEPVPEPEPAPLHLWQPTSTGASAPAPLIEPGPPASSEVAAPAVSTATGSHWSAGFHEPADDPFENTFSRQVGSASVSTNALVLPEMPVGSLAGPVPGTGEIIITGMVDVPSSIASTGAVPSVHDSPDIDDLIDPGDREFVSSDSAPVSAINAVSSHTATRNVISGPRPRGAMLTTVLIVSTVVMAIAAVTIFVVAAANGLF